jgi:histidine triad (HIT) family protein
VACNAEDCVFCRIIQGKVPAEKVYEDETVMAFKDANPTAAIHVLIVPKRHIPTLNDVQEGDPLLAHMGLVAKRIAEKLGVADSGYRFFINVNRGGGQVVFHLHAHLVSGNDFGMKLVSGAVMIAVVIRKIRSKLGL